MVKPTDSNPDATKKTSKVSDKISATADKGGTPDTAGKPDTDAGVTKISHPGQSAKVEETEKSDEEVVNEGEMPDGLKKYLDKKADKKDDKEEGYGMKTASKHMKKEEIDVTEHVDALVAGEADLSEEFKQKAATIFETAIKAKVKEESQRLQGEYETKLKEDTETQKAELVEKVDSYLNYVVEEWTKENELAIERGLKGEIAEDFISGLKQLFEDHYIDVPDEKYDVLGAQSDKIAGLEEKVNEVLEQNIALKEKNGELVREHVVVEVSEELTDTEVEKFKSLVEDVDFVDEDTFRAKLDTLKENYFPKVREEVITEQVIDNEVHDSAAQDISVSDSMSKYMTAITKTKARAQ